MSAKVAQTPPGTYKPKGMTDCMVECDECSIEWGWGAPYDSCQRWASQHNAQAHPDLP